MRLFGDPVLKQRAREVEELTDDLVTLVNGMYDTMDLEDGVGLAAPQVGVRKRIFTFDLHEGEGPGVVINPEIVESEGEVLSDEGCLSVPGFWGRLNRAERVSVKALDRHGKELRIRDAEGLFAQVLQHEIDHLDGYLYVDRMETLEKLQRSEPIRKREADARRARREAGLDEEDEDHEHEELPD